MTDLILVEKPEALNIPYFALSREPQSYIQRLDLASELDREGPDPRRLFGGKIAAWIHQHQTTKGPGPMRSVLLDGGLKCGRGTKREDRHASQYIWIDLHPAIIAQEWPGAS